jgi:excisionase family DNA binding protein
MLLTPVFASPTPRDKLVESEAAEDPPPAGSLEELVETIESDEELLAAPTPLQIPHIELPGALAGGGATEQPYCKASGTIILKTDKDPKEKRRFNRRLKDRRSSETPVGEDRRIVERRIWLRREEDRHGKKLLTVTDAADMLGAPIEQIYRWLEKTDIPFYQVTDGKEKKLRFDVDELFQWYSLFSSEQSDS